MSRKTIVVGIRDHHLDGFSAALTEAAAYARSLKADIRLVNAETPKRAEVWEPGLEVDVARYHANRALRHAGRVLGPQTEVSTHISRHHSVLSPAEALVEESRDAELIILQRRDRGQVRSLVAGSVTYSVAARAQCPVLVVHQHDQERANRCHGVVVAVDERGHGFAALRTAFVEADRRAVPLTALQTWTPPLDPYYSYYPPTPEQDQQAIDASELSLAMSLAGFGAEFPDVRVAVETIRDDPGSALIRSSADADLVVLARHTNRHRGRLNLGATVRAVVARASCPVLVTPSDRPVERRQQSTPAAVSQGVS